MCMRQSGSLLDICLNIYLAKNVLAQLEITELIQELMGKIYNLYRTEWQLMEHGDPIQLYETT